MQNNPPPFENYKEAFFDLDGSLCDLLILGTNKHDWQQFLAFLLSSPYTLDFSINGHPTPLPQDVEALFAIDDEHTAVLSIDQKQLALTCCFFTSEQIELNLDPRDFQNALTSERQIAPLLDFICTVARLLHKTVILTPEGLPSMPFLRFDPETDEAIKQ